MDPGEPAPPPSLVRGGLLYRVERSLRLFRDPRHEILGRWAFMLLVGWLPAVVLTLIGGLERGELLPLHARFLVAIPLLLLAEGLVDDRVRRMIEDLRETELVAPAHRAVLDGILARVPVLRDHRGVAAAIVACALGASFVPEAREVAAPASSYEAYVSLPLFRVLLFTWAWRWIVWTWMLARIARLDLCLVPTHPDAAGGLGIIERPSLCFGVALGANAAVMAGELGRRIVVEGATLMAYANAVIGFGIIAAVVIAGPSCFFSRALVRARRIGQAEYGAFAVRHNRRFHDRWISGTAPDPLGAPDISSLADVSVGLACVDRMRFVPLGHRALMLVLLLAVSPALPVLPTQIPMSELVREALGKLV